MVSAIALDNGAHEMMKQKICLKDNIVERGAMECGCSFGVLVIST